MWSRIFNATIQTYWFQTPQEISMAFDRLNFLLGLIGLDLTCWRPLCICWPSWTNENHDFDQALCAFADGGEVGFWSGVCPRFWLWAVPAVWQDSGNTGGVSKTFGPVTLCLFFHNKSRLNFIPALLLEQVCAFPPPLQTNPMWPMGKLFSCQVNILPLNKFISIFTIKIHQEQQNLVKLRSLLLPQKVALISIFKQFTNEQQKPV